MKGHRTNVKIRAVIELAWDGQDVWKIGNVPDTVPEKGGENR